MDTNAMVSSNQYHGNGWRFMTAAKVNSGALAANSNVLGLVKNASGDYSLNRTATGAETYTFALPMAEFDKSPNSSLGYNYSRQEQFGGSIGPVGAPGRPPFTGDTQLSPPTGSVAPTSPYAKGLMIRDVVLVYQVGVVNLTSAACSMNAITYKDSTANSVTNFPLTATTIVLTAQGTPHVITIPVTTPRFLYTDLSDLNVEFQFVMANTGTLRIYGLGVHFNYNLL
jgi:hypothetical protein